MLENNILLSKSLYSKKQKHQDIGGNTLSTVFENDFSTIQTNIRKGVNTGNFKVLFNTSPDISKSYGLGNWVKPSIGDNNEYWTFDEIVDNNDTSIQTTTKIEDDKINLKLDFSSLTSFAYFGSLSELIRSSVEGIVKDFPGSLYIAPKTDTTTHELYNPFEIDLFTSKTVGDQNDLRVFSNQFNNYEIVSYKYVEEKLGPCGIIDYKENKEQGCVYNITNFEQKYYYVYIKRQPDVNGEVKYEFKDEIVDALEKDNSYLPTIKLLREIIIDGSNEQCLPNDSFKLIITYVYNHGNFEPCTLLRNEVSVSFNNIPFKTTGSSPFTLEKSFHIRPKQEFINSFFNNLNDFQRELLNTSSNPRYTSNFKVPLEDENGRINYVDNKFTWQTPDGWNLDVTSVDYVHYMNKLIEAAEFYDNYKTDNIYRMLTHDSIKNMDWSFERVQDDMKAQEYLLGTSRISKILRLYGRSYDEIKKYIHGIELTNNLTYNEKDNYPDIYLKTNLEYEGWQPLSLSNLTNKKEDITNNLYYGHKEGYSKKETEIEFYRRLLINSPHITRWKGTKHGVEMIMNLFGIDRNRWEIKEYVYYSASPFPYKSDISSGNIKEGIPYIVEAGVADTNYITYNDIKYYNGDNFIGVKGKNNFTENGDAEVYEYDVDTIAYLNKMRNHNMNGRVYYEDDLSDENEGEYQNIDDLHDLCIERHYQGEFKKCTFCKGVGTRFIKGIKQICPNCHGTGVLREYIGVPAFKGNSDILYYQQYGGWYQETYRQLKMVNTYEELFKLNRSELNEGDIYFVNKTIPEDKTQYWVLTNIDNYNTASGWYNIDKTQYNDNINKPDGVIKITTTHNDEIGINLYNLVNMKDINTGNNPHMGDYDNGTSYLTHFGTLSNTDKGGLFKYVIDNSDDCIKDKPQYTNMLNKGFKISSVVDTKKCWGVDNNDLLIKTLTYSINTLIRKSPNDSGYNCNNYNQDTGSDIRINEYKSNIKYYNIINVKNIDVIYDTDNKEYNKEEFYNTILPYLEEMIPSTSIINLTLK